MLTCTGYNSRSDNSPTYLYVLRLVTTPTSRSALKLSETLIYGLLAGHSTRFQNTSLRSDCTAGVLVALNAEPHKSVYEVP